MQLKIDLLSTPAAPSEVAAAHFERYRYRYAAATNIDLSGWGHRWRRVITEALELFGDVVVQ